MLIIFLSQLLFGKNFKPTEKLQRDYNIQSYTLYLDSSIINTLPHLLYFSLFTHMCIYVYRHTIIYYFLLYLTVSHILILQL